MVEMDWHLGDLEATSHAVRYRPLLRALTDDEREQIAMESRHARGLAAMRAECAGVPCPRCKAEPGEACKRVGRHSLWAGGLRGYHVERSDVAFSTDTPKAAQTR